MSEASAGLIVYSMHVQLFIIWRIDPEASFTWYEINELKSRHQCLQSAGRWTSLPSTLHIRDIFSPIPNITSCCLIWPTIHYILNLRSHYWCDFRVNIALFYEYVIPFCESKRRCGTCFENNYQFNLNFFNFQNNFFSCKTRLSVSWLYYSM